MTAILLLALTLGVTPMEGFSGVVWVHSDACKPCKTMEPAVVKLVLEGEAVMVFKVATQAELVDNGCKVVPTTLLYRQGKEIERREGVVTEGDLRAWLKSVSEKSRRKSHGPETRLPPVAPAG